jgi:hypothetical protein
VNVLSCAKAIGRPVPARFQSAFDRPMDTTKAGVMTSLAVAYDYCIDGLKELNDADLFKMAVFKGHSAARFDIFWDGFTRAAHALGQADVLLRLKGIAPPETGPKHEF